MSASMKATLTLVTGLFSSIASAQAPAALPEPPPLSRANARQTQLLQVVRDFEAACKHAFYLDKSTCKRSIVADMSPHWVPVIRSFCGNSLCGTVPEATIVRQAIAAAGAYGFHLKPEVAVAAGGGAGTATFEAADVEAKVAIKLHGQSAVGMFAHGPAEPDATELDAGEAAWLRQRGWRIFDVHMDSFVLMDSDEFTPTLVFLVGFCEFLDGITDGDDALLTGIAFPRPIELPLPEPKVADAEGALIRCEAGNGLSMGLRKKTVIRFEFAGTAAAAAKAGSAAVLAVSIDMHTAKAWTLAERLPSPVAALRVEQEGADGTAWRQQSGTQRIFLDGRFDATRPFTLELELAPGSYSIHGPARLGVAPR